MKKLLLLSIFAFFSLVSANVFGQSAGTSINPSVGEIYTYKVNYHSSSTYSWSLQASANGGGSELFGGTSSATAVATTADTNSNTVTVTWVNPTVSTVYYLHLTETNATCTNRKVLAIQPVNNFKLDIVNVDASGVPLTGTSSTTYSICAPEISTVAWNGTSPVTGTNATDFNYNYGTNTFYYKITASGINFSNTKWTPSVAIAQANGVHATVTIETQIGGTFGASWGTGIFANNSTSTPEIPAGAGNDVIWVKVTVNNNTGTPLTANENLTNNDFTFTLNAASKDQNNNTAVDLGNGHTVQTQLARPDSGAIQY